MKFLKFLAALAAIGVLGVLFVRSAQSSRAEPFTVARADLSWWTLALEPEGASLLSLRPHPELAPPLGTQIFRRAGESLNYPNPPGLPLMLRSEFDRAALGRIGPDALLALARDAGIEQARFEPRCMGRRRISEPGVVRGVYFVLFDAPAFDAFRRQVAAQLSGSGGDASLFDPSAVSPVLIVAGLDGDFGRWMPIKAEPDTDCLAPISVE